MERSISIEESSDARVKVVPSGYEFSLQGGESIFHAAIRAGFQWPTRCFGQAQCLACSCLVIAGAEHLAPVDAKEADCLALLSHLPAKDGERRLACQATLANVGTIVVEKRGVRDEA